MMVGRFPHRLRLDCFALVFSIVVTFGNTQQTSTRLNTRTQNHLTTEAPKLINATTLKVTSRIENATSQPSTIKQQTVDEQQQQEQTTTWTPDDLMTTTAAPVEEDCPPLRPNMDIWTQDQFTSKLTEACLYDKLTKPDSHGKPLPVYMQIDLSHIESAENQLQFKAHMLVQYLYTDPRLRFEHISPKRGNILGQQLLRDKIWVPHITIRNDKDTSVSGIDGRDVFVSISPQGHVVYSYRMTATFYCWMNLQKFPFDSQDCDLRWYSWTYNSTNLVLKWEVDVPVKVAQNLHLTEFILTGSDTEETVVPASFTKGAFVGNFSELVFKFRLSREVGYYIMDYFLPSILLVCTSWVTFWLQADASAPRVTLGTSTMLAFITLNGGLTKNLPKVSYIKASEIWFLACACFIFCSMAEFAFVNVIWRRRKKVEMKKASSKHILKGALTPSLARKQLRKAESASSLYKPSSCTSLDDNTKPTYLSVHSFPGSLNVPTIAMPDQEDMEDSVTSIPVPNGTNNKEAQQQQAVWATMTPHEVANWIDKKARIVFPITFLIFNIFYWTFVYVL